MSWHLIRRALGNKAAFLGNAVADRHKADARILSVAVHPAWQGRGLATLLCRKALARFDRLRVPLVRLEVRPDNPAALRPYARLGFRRVGSMEDAQGEWWVMTRLRPVGIGGHDT